MSPAKGMEEIPLDLPETVEAGLAKAKEMDEIFRRLARGSYGPPGEEPAERLMLTWHLPYWSLINRAVSLHRGIVAVIEQANPHATFTLMRAYLELVATAYHVVRHPEYVNVLAFPAEDWPEGLKPRKPGTLVAKAAKDMPGVRRVYDELSGMAHYTSTTAMWMAFGIEDTEDGRTVLHYRTNPHWKKPDDPRIALAMLLENDRAVIDLLAEFARAHVWPEVAKATEGAAERMLMVAWDRGVVAWWSSEVWTVSPWSHELLEEVGKVLDAPATRRRSEEVEGTIGEAVETLEPDGSVEHAMAALLGLPGASSVVVGPQLRSTVRSDDPADANPEGP